jgi:hypothetical protein
MIMTMRMMTAFWMTGTMMIKQPMIALAYRHHKRNISDSLLENNVARDSIKVTNSAPSFRIFNAFFDIKVIFSHLVLSLCNSSE